MDFQGAFPGSRSYRQRVLLLQLVWQQLHLVTFLLVVF